MTLYVISSSAPKEVQLFTTELIRLFIDVGSRLRSQVRIVKSFRETNRNLGSFPCEH